MNKQIKYGIILQYVQMGLSIIVNLIYTPIMIRVLGDSEYGIYSLAASIISYLNLFTLGFGASYIRFYSKYKVNNDNESIKKLNALYISVFFILGLVALTAGLILASNVGVFFNDTYSENDLGLAKILMTFLSVNLFISFPASVFTSYITSQEKFIFQKIVNMGKTIISPCLCIGALFLGYGSIGMVVITTVISILIDIVNVLFCIFKLKMRFKFGRPDWLLLKDIAIFSVFIALNQIIDQINWQTDKIILGKMINATAVAVYAVAANINTMYISFSTAVSSVFAPRVNRIVMQNEPDMDEKLTALFIKVGRLQFFIMMLVLTGFIFFGKYFIIRWAGETYSDAYYIVLLLICPVTITLIQNVGIDIQRAKNKHKFRSLVYLIMALINVGISIWFCTLWGVIGVAVGTTLSLVIANVIIMNIYYHKQLGIDIIEFWKNIIITVPAFIIPIIFGVLLRRFYTFRNLIDFGVFVLLYTIVYVLSIWFLGLKKEEKQTLIRKRKRLGNENGNG